MFNMASNSPTISPGSNISSSSVSRASTPRLYKKRPLEYCDEKGFKRRKNTLPATQYKPQMTNVIVVPQNQIQASQLELQTHNNTSEIASLYPFPVIVQAPLKRDVITQQPSIPTVLSQVLLQSNSIQKDVPCLLKHIKPLVLVCVGDLLDSPTQFLKKDIKKSYIFKDICDSILPTANKSWKVCLSPESLALFVVNYLTSVSNGGVVMKELFETMLLYAKMGEQDWMQVYCQFNNSIWKMQVSHLARLAAYQSNSNVMIMQSAISLVNGVNNALCSLSELKKYPDFIVVLYNNSIHTNKPLEFCVIVLNMYISKTIEEQDVRLSKDKVNLLSFIKSPDENQIRKILHKRNQLLRDRALPPFRATSFSTYCTAATLERVLPQTSNIVEYQPRGPFKQQEITALALLRKVKDLRNSVTDTSYISNFTSVDFYIFVPTTSTLYWQTAERLSESNLIRDAIRSQLNDERIPSISIAENHVIKLDLSQVVNPQLMALINLVQTRTHTLFVCVQDNAHKFTTLNTGALRAKNNSVVVSNPCLAYLNLLHMPNVLSIAVTSSPLSLLSSQSCIPVENEINWRDTGEINPCLLTYPQGACYLNIETMLEENTDVKLFEDTVFEDKVEHMCQESGYENSTFDIIRARLLVQEYTTALLKLTGQAKNLTCTGETFTMLHDLVSQPMNNNYGYGPMVVLRVHSIDVGKFVYDQLVNARKDVGLQYRFEIILDDGSQDFNINPYFVQRMRTWKFGKHSNDKGAYQCSYFSALTVYQTSWQPKTFLQLNNLPCILIVAGDERGGETLPKSVSHYDLRLVSGISITSHTLNLDLGYIHHYVDGQKNSKQDKSEKKQFVNSSAKSSLPNNIFIQDSKRDETLEYITNGVESNNEDSRMNTEEFQEHLGQSIDDTIPMISISPAKSPLSQISTASNVSHNSNKKFSIEHLTANVEPAVTSYQMDTEEMSNSLDIPDGPSSGRNSVISSFSDPEISHVTQECSTIQTESFQNVKSTIWKTPTQAMDYTNVCISKPQISNSMPHTIKYKPTTIQPSSLSKVHTISSLNNISISSLNSREEILSDGEDFDDEDEDDAIGVPDYYNSLICLLSRPYKNILTSKFATLNIRDILPPTRDLVFEENQERQPQDNTNDYAKLSKYYRKWANPCTNHIDLIRASLSAKYQMGKLEPIATRFLLTGPPQVGKTGAYILFIKLLQDFVHSSNFVKIYDKFECENSNSRIPITTTNKSNISIPKSIDILKSKFDANPINLYQHEKLSKIAYIEGGTSKSFHSTQVDEPQIQDKSQDKREFENQLMEASSLNIKQEILSPLNEDSISTHNFNEFSPSKFENAPPMKEDCFSVIQQLPDLAYAYDKSHTCPSCIDYYRRSNNSVLELTYRMNNGHGPMVKFYIPQQQMANFHFANKTLIRMNLAIYECENPMKQDNFMCRTPIFTPSTGRASTGLFNLAHIMKHQKHMHIIVVNENEVPAYRKQWPTHVIMAVPNMPEFYSLGGVMEFIKQFATENYNSYEKAVLNQKFIIWPYILVLGDSCLAFKSTPAQVEPPNTSQNNCVTLFDILKLIEVDPEFVKYGAMSMRQWTSKSIPEENFSKSFLNTSFLYLHVAMLKDVHFDPLSHTCIAADVTLKLLAFGIPFCRINNFSYIKKFIKAGGESFHDVAYSKMRSKLISNPNQFIGTPDCDQVFSISLSGSHIMEAYLQKTASKIFPLAKSKEHPVLQINKFMNFSDEIFVSFVHERSHNNYEQHKHVKYGGLLMCSSEMLEDSKFLKNFQFAQGATICLVTKNRSNLRKEITRLNLEDSWRFKLSNEAFTLCTSESQPLYFYTGRYDILQESN